MTTIDFEGILVRIKAFLNSSDLTDSPAARELYEQFRSCNDQTVVRLMECDILLQKKQKIEALILARRQPELLETIAALASAERKTLETLADLYGWEELQSFLPEAVDHLKRAINEMEDFRPLLTEYRRIARTNQVRNKLILLRRISKLDQGNPEWESARMEVENVYLVNLIKEAQQSIVDQHYERTTEIYDELLKSQWLVTIPSAVIKKLAAVVDDYLQREKKKKAVVILEKINTAYGAFDFVALEDADLRWKNLCEIDHYVPDENEKKQYGEAHAALVAELEKRRKEQEFQNLINTTMTRIDQAAPLEEVEKSFAELTTMDQSIPGYLSNRVIQYRRDVERARRAQIIFKTSKILGVAAIAVLVLGGSGLWLSQYLIEQEQAKSLRIALTAKNIVRAKSLLAEIEKKYPKLASRPEISKCRAQLLEMQADAEKKQGELKALFAELEIMLKQPVPQKVRCEQKLARAGKLIVQESDKARLDALREQFEDIYRNLSLKAENQFYAELDRLKRLRDQALERISAEDFDTAQALLGDIGKLAAAIREIELLDEHLLTDNKELLQSQDTLRAMLDQKKTQRQQQQALYKRVVEAANLSSLEDAVGVLYKQVPPQKGSPERKMYDHLLTDAKLMHDVFNYQNGRMDAEKAASEKCSLFSLRAKKQEYEKQRQDALKTMTDIFDAIYKSTNHEKVSFVRMQGLHGPIDLYFLTQSIAMVGNKTRMKKSDGTLIEITAEHGYFSLIVGDETSPQSQSFCKLLVPRKWNGSTLRKSIASHQLLIEKIFQQLNTPGDKDPFQTGVDFIEMILTDPLCAPYWKMQLSLRILNIIAPLDLTPEKTLVELKRKLLEIKDKNASAGNALEDKFLNEKITLFLNSFDVKSLKKVKTVNFAYQKFLKSYYEREYLYLGFVIKDGDQLICKLAKQLKNGNGDVFAFTSDGTNCRLVGQFKNGEIILDERYRDQLAGYLLFTAFPNDSLDELKKILLQADIVPQEIEYPAFWPVNYREK